MRKNNLLALAATLCVLSPLYAAGTNETDTIITVPQVEKIKVPAEDDTPVVEREIKENVMPANFFTIMFYKPNYVLPYNYTFSPYNSVYQGFTPNNESLNRDEIKYQISLKVPIVKNMFHLPTSIYLAYTQKSFWQAYNKYAFFRETDYEPEIFVANEVNWQPIKSWLINSLNIGLVHQSNGFGDSLERSWNRVYVQAISSTGNWMFSIKPWFVFHDHSYTRYNPNLTNYLGYGEVLVAYKWNSLVFSLSGYHLVENGFERPTFEGTWSFPITSYLDGYLDVFSGYGQSLIEYNHRTNSIGLGIALSNWV